MTMQRFFFGFDSLPKPVAIPVFSLQFSPLPGEIKVKSRCTRSCTRAWCKLGPGPLEAFILSGSTHNNFKTTTYVYFVRERETGECAAAKYLRQVKISLSRAAVSESYIFRIHLPCCQEKHKVRREAEVLRSLIQSAFVVQLVGLFELMMTLMTGFLTPRSASLSLPSTRSWSPSIWLGATSSQGAPILKHLTSCPCLASLTFPL